MYSKVLLKKKKKSLRLGISIIILNTFIINSLNPEEVCSQVNFLRALHFWGDQTQNTFSRRGQLSHTRQDAPPVCLMHSRKSLISINTLNSFKQQLGAVSRGEMCRQTSRGECAAQAGAAAAGGSTGAAFQRRMLCSSPASHAPGEAQAVLGDEQRQAELPMKWQSPSGIDVFGLSRTNPGAESGWEQR